MAAEIEPTQALGNTVDDFSIALRVLLDTAVRCGLPADIIRSLVDSELDRLSSSIPPIPSNRGLTLPRRDFLSAIVGLWHREPRFTDSMGDPKPLPMAGVRASFEELFNASEKLVDSAGFSVSEALCELVDHSAAYRTEDGLWLPSTEFFNVNTSDSSGVFPQMSYLRQFSETVGYNLDKTYGQGRYCAVARVAGFPLSAVKQVQYRAREEGHQFLKNMDSILCEGRDNNIDDREASATVGVGVYFFQRR